jgi:hypothetical protein
MTSREREIESSAVGRNLLEKRFPQQQEICTNGPSFPTIRPALVAKIIPILLMKNVHLPKYPYMMKPERIVLISGIPE